MNKTEQHGHASDRWYTGRWSAISLAVVCTAGTALTGQGIPRAAAEPAAAAADVMEWTKPGYYASAWKIPQGVTRITVRLWSPGGRGGGGGAGGGGGGGGRPPAPPRWEGAAEAAVREAAEAGAGAACSSSASSP
ncbi:hypothetical protein [Streptomyces sp. NPDC050848]|uniref:hypothetical protein n=1 Tax=Streptomyces sp. NPDC050848 TaxID=3155791 RepID=UPI0033C91EBC